MPDTLLALNSSSEEGAEVPEEGVSADSPDSNTTGSSLSHPMSQSQTLTQQRSPLQPYSLNDHKGASSRVTQSQAAAVAAARQRWVVFNKARIQEIFEATLSEMNNEWSNTTKLVPGLRLAPSSDTQCDAVTSSRDNNTTTSSSLPQTDLSNEKRNMQSGSSSTKRSYSQKQGSNTKDNSSQKHDGEGKENNSRVPSPSWSVSGSSEVSDDPRPLTPTLPPEDSTPGQEGGDGARSEVSAVNDTSKSSGEETEHPASELTPDPVGRHSPTAPADPPAVSAAVRGHQASVHTTLTGSGCVGAAGKEESNTSTATSSPEQVSPALSRLHRRESLELGGRSESPRGSSASASAPAVANPTEPMVQWGSRERSGSGSPGPGLRVMDDAANVESLDGEHKARPEDTPATPQPTASPPLQVAGDSGSSKSPAANTPPHNQQPDNPTLKKPHRVPSAKPTSRAPKRGSNGSKKVTSTTTSSTGSSDTGQVGLDNYDNNNGGEKGKECWVALNKAMVFDIVDLAMSQSVTEVTCPTSTATTTTDPTTATTRPQVLAPGVRQGSEPEERASSRPVQGIAQCPPQPPAQSHSELASLLGGADSQPPPLTPIGSAKLPLKRNAPVGPAGRGNGGRNTAKRRRVVAGTPARAPIACDSSRPWTIPDRTSTASDSNLQPQCGLDLRSDQAKVKDQHGSSTTSSSSQSTNVSVSSVVLSALLATNNPSTTECVTAGHPGGPPPMTSATASVSAPPSPILIDEEEDDTSSQQLSIDSQTRQHSNRDSCSISPSKPQCHDRVNECRPQGPGIAALRRGQFSAQMFAVRGQVPSAGDSRLARNSAGRASTPLPQIPPDRQPVRRKARSASHESPKHGWVALSKEEVHTIVDSVMTRMFLESEQPSDGHQPRAAHATRVGPDPPTPASQCTNVDSDVQASAWRNSGPQTNQCPATGSDNISSCETQGPLIFRDHNTPASSPSFMSSSSSSFSAAAGEEKRREEKRLMSLPTPTLHNTKVSQRRVSFACIDQLAQGSPPESPNPASYANSGSFPAQTCHKPFKWKSNMMLRSQGSQDEEPSQDMTERDDEDEEIEVERTSSDSESSCTQPDSTPVS